MNNISFDESIPTFVQAIVETLGTAILSDSWLLRDAAGRLTLITEPHIDQKLIDRLSSVLTERMSPYIRAGRTVVFRDTYGLELVLNGASIIDRAVSIMLNGTRTIVLIRLVDRRIVGRDWQSYPIAGWQPPAPARVVFASLKGGVGRSTALAVLAADLARDNKNVLVVDLDLEAPGIGTMLVGQANRPRYGVLDWMVESNLHDVDAEFMAQMIAPSDFTSGRGIIDVVPAVGTASDRQPYNVLSKLARAYLEDEREGLGTTFLAKVGKLLDSLTARRPYDAILVDARAGLHETTAASILGLGADVLFFGMNTSQTFESYRFLFAQMRDVLSAQDVSHKLEVSPDSNDADADNLAPSQVFIRRLKFVHAKSAKDDIAQVRFRDKLHGLFSEFLYKSESFDFELASDGTPEIIFHPEYSLDDETAPHYAWPIYGSTLYAEFDPFAESDRESDNPVWDNLHQLDSSSYEEAFGAFLDNVRERIRLPRGEI